MMCQRQILIDSVKLGTRTLEQFGARASKTNRDTLIRKIAIARNTIEAIDEVLFGALPGQVSHEPQ